MDAVSKKENQTSTPQPPSSKLTYEVPQKALIRIRYMQLSSCTSRLIPLSLSVGYPMCACPANKKEYRTSPLESNVKGFFWGQGTQQLGVHF